jgi:predicted NBD/HSP70 family sugar kinase
VAISTQHTGDLGAILRILRDGQPRTRAELTQITGQGRSTLGARLDRLLSAGLVNGDGEAASGGGRPPAIFAFNATARVVVAVDLGATHAHVAVTDLGTTILADHLEAISISEGPEAVLDRVVKIAVELVAQAGRTTQDIAGVGIGLPGPVDHTTGRPTNPPIMPGWDGSDVVSLVSPRLGGAPVLVDNDVNLMALGEHHAQYSSVGHLLFVKVATGIGSGIISDGVIQRGAQGAAGDIGHIAVPGGAEVVCRCGNTGCLEAIASGRAIADALSASGLPASSNSDVVTLVRAGNAQASRAVRAAGRDLGQILAACVSMLNPSVIVVGGKIAEAGEHLLAGVREVVYGRSLPLATEHLRIVTSRTMGRAGIIGASTMVIDHVLSEGGLSELF